MTLTEYEAIYLDDKGDKHSYLLTSTDVRTAMNNLFELCPDAKQIIRCVPKPMFED